MVKLAYGVYKQKTPQDMLCQIIHNTLDQP